MSNAGIGDKAPSFKDKAFPTNFPVQIPNPNNTPTLLLFIGYQTAPKIEGVVSTIRRVVADPDKLLIINVVDLKGVPRLMRGAAQKIIKAAYEQAAMKIPEGYDPASQLIMLTDWKGKIGKSYSVTDVNQALALISINGDGTIANRYQGDDAEHVALDMVLPLISS